MASGDGSGLRNATDRPGVARSNSVPWLVGGAQLMFCISQPPWPHLKGFASLGVVRWLGGGGRSKLVSDECATLG